MTRQILLTIISLLLGIFASFGQERETITLTKGWKFHLGQADQAFQKSFDDSGWEDVAIPHDWAIGQPFIEDGDGNTGKLPWKGEGWYRTKLDLPENYQGKSLYLLCDGIMAFPKIYVNGKLAGKWDYGYNSFFLDITKLVNIGEENILAVHADTRSHDSRWYPGAGIYRKIQLIAVNPVHVAVWGTHITTPIIKPHYADVLIATTINNHASVNTKVKIVHSIFTDDNKKVGEQTVSDEIVSQKNRTLEATITLSNPRLWDLDSPHLYSVETQVFQGEKLVDTYISSFGVRDIRFTADNGFYMNDKRVQLKGVNLHHDHGPLGAAFNVRAMERQLEIMKSMGVNAIRNSHNTAAPELLDLCDKMGLLMFDEIFDKYDRKADIVDTTDFEDFAHRNIKNFVMRDRNHPSIFLWSVGNEIADVQTNRNNGFYQLKTMINYLEKYDDTRPNTLVCDILNAANNRHF
ncbi:MAG: glycoside hydrolase family 2, partial [Bacteroidetes bacterium]|nr:glycoside hydrolase family 2 [Bacteroidota bacterium]